VISHNALRLYSPIFRAGTNNVIIPFFGEKYIISKRGIADESGNRPDYGVCVILSRYLLLCPATKKIFNNSCTLFCHETLRVKLNSINRKPLKLNSHDQTITVPGCGHNKWVIYHR